MADEPTEICVLDWHITPFRAERFYEIWLPAAERVLAFGATRWTISRSIDDPLHFRQTSSWRDRDDFERYWASDEVSSIRQDALKYFQKPVLPTWHTVVAGAAIEPVGEEVAGAAASANGE